MRKKSKISVAVSALLLVVFLIGSTGAVIVKHTCASSGLTEYKTEIFTSEFSHKVCKCCNGDDMGNKQHGESMEGVCCTFSSDKLSFTEYNTIYINSLSVIDLPVISAVSISADNTQAITYLSTTYRNKYGGRDLIKRTCQLLI